MATKNTYVAVHAIDGLVGMEDAEGNPVTSIPAGTEFIPDKGDIKRLEKLGAIRKASEVAAEEAETDGTDGDGDGKTNKAGGKTGGKAK